MYSATDRIVCVFRKPTGASGKGLYELKQECYSEYSPYYCHYTRTEQAKVGCNRLCLILLIFLYSYSLYFFIKLILLTFLGNLTLMLISCSCDSKTGYPVQKSTRLHKSDPSAEFFKNFGWLITKFG